MLSPYELHHHQQHQQHQHQQHQQHQQQLLLLQEVNNNVHEKVYRHVLTIRIEHARAQTNDDASLSSHNNHAT